MTLAAGTEIQCAKGARIIVKGQLLCRGTPGSPVVFHPSWKRPAGAASISVTIAGAAAMIGGYLAAEYFNSQYRLETTSSRATFLGDKRDRAAFIGNTGIILCSVGVIGLGISILF
jgi:hypothetical protein